MQKTTIIAVLAAGLVVAGCTSYTGPAGEGRHSHLFGVAATQNLNAQMAYGDPAGRIRRLNEVFRAAAPDTVTFDFDQASLDASARAALDEQAAWLKQNQGVRMTVVGHTDKVGPEGYNKRLGLRRARAAVRYLTSRGVSRSRLDAVESRGENQPVVDTAGRERRNRRAVTSVAGFERQYVGLGLDGKAAQRIYTSYLGGFGG